MHKNLLAILFFGLVFIGQNISLNAQQQQSSESYKLIPGRLDSIGQIASLDFIKPDQVYYIDVWSLYCPPCFVEFQEILKMKEGDFCCSDIEVLYLCAESPRFESTRYLSIITKYDLQGYHLRLSSSGLVKEMMRQATIMDKGSSIGLPLFYFLKDGRLYTAPRMSDSTNFRKRVKEIKGS